MQNPDSNGYVNITWPSKNIPHGGIFHTRVAEPTDSQQHLLKGFYLIHNVMIILFSQAGIK